MHGIVRLLPGRQVAAGIPAVRRSDIQAVVVVDMAGRAGRHLAAVGHQRMRIRQREAERSVVKRAVRPFRDGMALSAGRGR